MVPPAGERTKVLIIGGGPAALAVAYELTADGRAADYELTILQPGWRLGGKCASGRNAHHGERIEEHGLHVWFGCYDNARALLTRCYDDLKRSGASHAFTSWDDAFEGFDLSILWQRRDGNWTFQALEFPRHRTPPPNFLGFAIEAITWAGRRLLDLQEELTEDETVDVDFSSALDSSSEYLAVFNLEGGDAGGPRETVARVASRLQRRVAAAFIDTALELVSLGQLAECLDAFHKLAYSMLPDRVRDRGEVIFFLDTIDLLIATLKGVLRDDLLACGFDTINHEDLADWLRRHGADIRDDPLEWPAALRGVYDGCFAFENGDPDTPSMAAGRALQGAVRCLLYYRGSVLYRMRSGMGDTVIAPLYQALELRNRDEDGKIDVRFFHAATALRPASDGESVAEVEIVEQVPLSGPYTPLREVGYGEDGGTMAVWPSEPPWELLPDLGDAGVATAARLEHVTDPFNGTHRTLRAGEDFDYVVLAAPPGVQMDICSALRDADPRYAEMLDNSPTVVTQASQLWLSRSADELGQPFASESLMSGFVEPLDTYCDMAHLLQCEQWQTGMRVRHVAYFCGVLADAGITTQAEADDAALEHLEDLLDNHARLVWSGAPEAKSSSALRDALASADAAAGRQERLRAQYWRANWAQTERYGLTLPGTVAYRLGPTDTAFDNLVLAGDWTRNGFDAGCVEAAITSGMQAANAICGCPALDAIAGLNGPDGFPSQPRER